ncbi:flagellar motor protein MotB [Lacihabitans sp. CCS-44]|uniref:OmpA family protein n=1 Tax=Lacihabitans sp. CCS-44 TaxID=2487331 RepID=UPI0020CD0A32|nr:OmpA family protein [Lacihabitans sp. CCS-44]MCP9754207.1 flagellar motor protein MotB [Lacihabitans sp. CCS-44]
MFPIKKIQILIGFVWCLTSFLTQAQSNKLRAANTEFDKMSYAQAVRNYESYLGSGSHEKDQQKEALTKLAFSYRKLQDSKNAERVYKDLFKDFDASVDSEQILYYAQALANNGKYRESQKMYSRYGEQQKEDLRGRKFTVAYMDNSTFFKDSSLYDVNFVYPLNTRYSDFSPMFYENGLVFVSARNEGSGIKRVFNQNETPFLDLFLFSDTMSLRKETHKTVETIQASLGSSGKSAKPNKTQENDSFEDIEEPVIDEFSKSINSKYHEGPVTFFKDYKKIVFTRNNYNKGKAKKSEKGINMLKLFIATKKGNKWTDIKELPFNSNEYSTGHPALSPDNRKMYFVSDMPGGFGGTDIYVVDYREGNWGAPINLGREVNTEGNEMFPFVDEIGNFYFASDGHAGLGGLDMFYLEFRNGVPFGEVENLGAPINSTKDDFGFITDGNRSRGYFSSNRRKGYADDNIYAFTKGCNALNILVYDSQTNLPLANTELRMVKNGVNKQGYITNSLGEASLCLESGADFEFKAFKEGYDVGTITYGTMSQSLSKQQHLKIYLEPARRPLVKGRIVSEVDQMPIAGATVTLENERDGSVAMVITGVDGRYAFQPDRDGRYSVSAVKDNYATNTENIGKIKNSKKNYSVERNFGMIGEGDIFRLDNIYYDLDKSEIRADAKRELDNKVIPVLKKYPDLQIELRSHTDSRASEEYNQRLSAARARSVADYLVSRGVSSDRLVASGYGESELVNECDDSAKCEENAHQANRRTEFKILAVKEYLGARK